MGLDMFMFKVRKLSDKEVASLSGKNTQIFTNDILFFTKKDVEKEDTQDMLRDLKPYLTMIPAVTSFYDVEKIKADNDIPAEAMIGMRCHERNNTMRFTFYWKDGRKEVSFADTDYVIDENVEVYACHHEEIRYWRKNYELQNKIYENYDGEIENCGYYALNEEFLKELFPRRKYFDGILYHEWY